MSLAPVVVLPAPPHPTSRNTAARYYAALLRGLAEADAPPRALALDDGSADAAAAWADAIPGLRLESFAPDPIRRDLPTRLERLRRPMFDAAPVRMRERLAEVLAEGYDVLHVEEFHLGPFAAAHAKGLLSVLHSEARDVHAHTPQDARTRFRRARGVRAERLILRKQRRIRTISTELEGDVRAAGARAPITVIPLSLDLDGYEFRPEGRPSTVGLIGSMLWPPSRAAAVRLLQDVWPRVLAELPGAELVIAGWQADSLQEVAARTHSVTILSDIGDHSEFFDRIGLLAFPLEVGSGMKVKVLESMAMGVAVVTTAVGTEGLTATDGAVWRAATDKEFANAIVEALAGPTEREGRAQRARALVERQCAPKIVAAQLVELYSLMIAEGQ